MKSRYLTHVVMDDNVLAAQRVDRSIDRTNIVVKGEAKAGNGLTWRMGCLCDNVGGIVTPADFRAMAWAKRQRMVA